MDVEEVGQPPSGLDDLDAAHCAEVPDADVAEVVAGAD